MAEPLIVTLDGPAGVGKTTLARKVAQALGIAYLDTGAMFRATALKLGEGAWDLPGPELDRRLAGITFSLSGVGRNSVLRCCASGAARQTWRRPRPPSGSASGWTAAAPSPGWSRRRSP